MPTRYALPWTELHLHDGGNGRRYLLHVALPRAVAEGKAGDRRYPVIYMPDPQWDFALVQATAGNLAVDGAIPECIVVGVGYPGEDLDYESMRAVDLAPVPGQYHERGPVVGGQAEAFLGVLEREIVPFVEGRWPADPARRVLLGSSQGGLFGLYATFARPGLFPGVVAVSPAVIWANEWMFGLEERFAGPLEVRLFLSAAAEEWPGFRGAIVRFEAALRARARPGLRHEWRLIEGERHSGTKAEGFTRGLRYVLAAP
jgi:predicted alpha/beta superfamily hydrolase